MLTSGYEVVMVGEHPHLRTRDGVEYVGVRPLAEALGADTVIVPGVQDPLRERDGVLAEVLRKAAAAGSRMAALCGGTFVLASTGVLDGRRATTHWELSEDFRRRFPRVRFDPEQLFVRDDRILTSAGMLAAAELLLDLVASDLSESAASALGARLHGAPRSAANGETRRGSAADEDAEPPFTPLQEAVLEEILNVPALQRIARKVHMSERTLTRRFKQETGMTVTGWLNWHRVTRAKALLAETDYSVWQVAAMVGFDSADSLRRVFRQHGVRSPASFRHGRPAGVTLTGSTRI